MHDLEKKQRVGREEPASSQWIKKSCREKNNAQRNESSNYYTWLSSVDTEH